MKKKKPQGKVTPTGVSTKSYKPPVPSAKTKSEILPQSKKLTPRAKRLIIIITAVVLVLAIAGGIVAIVVYNINNNRRIDFLNDDLSEYVTLTRGDYIGADINVSVPPVSDDEVYTEVLKALASKKGNMLYHGDYMYTEPLGGIKVLDEYAGLSPSRAEVLLGDDLGDKPLASPVDNAGYALVLLVELIFRLGEG